MTDTKTSLLRPDRFESFKGEIEDDKTANRIEAGQAWRVKQMAERLDDLYDNARRFSNVVFEGGFPSFDDLSQAMDEAHTALYEWAKNEARLEGWHARGGGDTDA